MASIECISMLSLCGMSSLWFVDARVLTSEI